MLSYELDDVRRGLKQIEKLFAQLCLLQSKQGRKVHGSIPQSRSLEELDKDVTMIEYCKLQESFEFNGKQRGKYIIITLDEAKVPSSCYEIGYIVG